MSFCYYISASVFSLKEKNINCPALIPLWIVTKDRREILKSMNLKKKKVAP